MGAVLLIGCSCKKGPHANAKPTYGPTLCDQIFTAIGDGHAENFWALPPFYADSSGRRGRWDLIELTVQGMHDRGELDKERISFPVPENLPEDYKRVLAALCRVAGEVFEA